MFPKSSRSGRDDYRERDRDHRRHRSRSPGHRSSRREYEVDSYSSSRDYREREREDRYRDRRDDRGWDRDRGYPRRDREPRRDEQDRPPRRDRDLFEDRRGGGGGGRGGGRERERERDRERPPFDAAAGGRAERKKSASPPPKKKREPTPDLTEVVPILERRRRLTQWDIKPPGYENVTAEQAKLSGMFPLPGAPRQQPMDPSKLKAFMEQPAGTASGAALSPLNARQSKRLFVYNLPGTANEATLQDFFNLQLNGLNVVSGVDPCTSAQLSKDQTFALLEFKSPEDATMALAMDGISMEADVDMNGDANGSNAGMSIKRPKEYIVPTSMQNGDEEPGVLSNVVHDNPNKISIANIPVALTEEQITELLSSFGELKAFVLVKDTSTEQSKVRIAPDPIPAVPLTRSGYRILRIRRPGHDRHCGRRPQRHGARRTEPHQGAPRQHRRNASRRHRPHGRKRNVDARGHDVAGCRAGPRPAAAQHGHRGGAHGQRRVRR